MNAVARHDDKEIQETLKAMSTELVLGMFEADLRGRKEMWNLLSPEAQEVIKSAIAARVPPQILPVTGGIPPEAKVEFGFQRRFEEMLKEWSERVPVIKSNMYEVQQAYQYGRVFSIARESSLNILNEVQSSLAKAFAEGKSERDWIKEAEAIDWPKFRAMLGTIFRTNMQTAYQAGRIRQARESGVVGFKRLSVLDLDTRVNHRAAHNQYWSISDPNAGWYALPWGYNCRCTDVPITALEAERLGMIKDDIFVPSPWPPNAIPDGGFEDSPVRIIYG